MSINCESVWLNSSFCKAFSSQFDDDHNCSRRHWQSSQELHNISLTNCDHRWWSMHIFSLLYLLKEHSHKGVLMSIMSTSYMGQSLQLSQHTAKVYILSTVSFFIRYLRLSSIPSSSYINCMWTAVHIASFQQDVLMLKLCKLDSFLAYDQIVPGHFLD